MSIVYEGSVAVVTGGASGIGYGYCQGLASRGAKIVMVDYHQERLDEAAASLRESTNATVLPIMADVAIRNNLQAAHDEIMAKFGKINYLFNNAGIGSGQPIIESTPESWRTVVDINLLGVAWALQIFAPTIMKSDLPGYIVNTASMAGIVSPSNLGSYNATKHAVTTISETLRDELLAAGSDMGVGVLCPGLVNTPIVKNSQEVMNTPEEGADNLASPLSFGMSPRLVAERVFEAMERKTLYILTDGTFRQRFIDRSNEILAGFDCVDSSDVIANSADADIGVRIGDLPDVIDSLGSQTPK